MCADEDEDVGCGVAMCKVGVWYLLWDWKEMCGFGGRRVRRIRYLVMSCGEKGDGSEREERW